ncbi:MAG: hypothetical protein KBA51_07540, partial [Kiritimatiellae bacterium]|nr:hypothetical protein [Kiritimatiellia bacterium]
MPSSFVSTRRLLPGGFSAALGFTDALNAGLAPDGGLFMPAALPSWSADDWEALRSLDYPAVAERMLWPFVEGAMDREIFAER